MGNTHQVTSTREELELARRETLDKLALNRKEIENINGVIDSVRRRLAYCRRLEAELDRTLGDTLRGLSLAQHVGQDAEADLGIIDAALTKLGLSPGGKRKQGGRVLILPILIIHRSSPTNPGTSPIMQTMVHRFMSVNLGGGGTKEFQLDLGDDNNNQVNADDLDIGVNLDLAVVVKKPRLVRSFSSEPLQITAPHSSLHTGQSARSCQLFYFA